MRRVFIVNARGVFLEKVVISFTDRLLQKNDGLRIIEVRLRFRVAPQVVIPECGQGRIGRKAERVKGPVVQGRHAFFDLRKADPADTACGTREVCIDQVF